MPHRRDLTSYLTEYDLSSLSTAISDPVERQNLFQDSVSVQLLIDMCQKLTKVERRHGLVNSYLRKYLSVAGDGQLSDYNNRIKLLFIFHTVRKKEFDPYDIHDLTAGLEYIQRYRNRITLNELLFRKSNGGLYEMD